MKQETNSTFNEGLVMDLNPLGSPNNIMTDCVNGTLITYNGNEFTLQNDMGNIQLPESALPTHYIPVGMKEYGGIIYIASYNPLNKKFQLGSFPSPERNFNTKELFGATPIPLTKTDLNITTNYSEHTPIESVLGDIKINALNPGDKYFITYKIEYTSNITNLEDFNKYDIDIKYCLVDSDNQFYNIDQNKLAIFKETDITEYSYLPANMKSVFSVLLSMKDLEYFESSNNVLIQTSNEGIKQYNVNFNIYFSPLDPIIGYKFKLEGQLEETYIINDKLTGTSKLTLNVNEVNEDSELNGYIQPISKFLNFDNRKKNFNIILNKQYNMSQLDANSYFMYNITSDRCFLQFDLNYFQESYQNFSAYCEFYSLTNNDSFVYKIENPNWFGENLVVVSLLKDNEKVTIDSSYNDDRYKCFLSNTVLKDIKVRKNDIYVVRLCIVNSNENNKYFHYHILKVMYTNGLFNDDYTLHKNNPIDFNTIKKDNIELINITSSIKENNKANISLKSTEFTYKNDQNIVQTLDYFPTDNYTLEQSLVGKKDFIENRYATFSENYDINLDYTYNYKFNNKFNIGIIDNVTINSNIITDNNIGELVVEHDEVAKTISMQLKKEHGVKYSPYIKTLLDKTQYTSFKQKFIEFGGDAVESSYGNSSGLNKIKMGYYFGNNRTKYIYYKAIFNNSTIKSYHESTESKNTGLTENEIIRILDDFEKQGYYYSYIKIEIEDCVEGDSGGDDYHNHRTGLAHGTTMNGNPDSWPDAPLNSQQYAVSCPMNVYAFRCFAKDDLRTDGRWQVIRTSNYPGLNRSSKPEENNWAALNDYQGIINRFLNSVHIEYSLSTPLSIVEKIFKWDFTLYCNIDEISVDVNILPTNIIIRSDINLDNHISKINELILSKINSNILSNSIQEILSYESIYKNSIAPKINIRKDITFNPTYELLTDNAFSVYNNSLITGNQILPTITTSNEKYRNLVDNMKLSVNKDSEKFNNIVPWFDITNGSLRGDWFRNWYRLKNRDGNTRTIRTILMPKDLEIPQ